MSTGKIGSSVQYAVLCPPKAKSALWMKSLSGCNRKPNHATITVRRLIKRCDPQTLPT